MHTIFNRSRHTKWSILEGKIQAIFKDWRVQIQILGFMETTDLNKHYFSSYLSINENESSIFSTYIVNFFVDNKHKFVMHSRDQVAKPVPKYCFLYIAQIHMSLMYRDMSKSGFTLFSYIYNIPRELFYRSGLALHTLIQFYVQSSFSIEFFSVDFQPKKHQVCG